MENDIRKDIELEVRRLFAEDQEKHRNYIEGQINSLKWIAGVIAAIVFGTFVFFFGKTYSSLEDKIDATLGRIETDYKIEQKVQKRIDDYTEYAIDKAVVKVDSILTLNIPLLIDKIEPKIEIKINHIFEKYEGEKLKNIISDKIEKLEKTKIQDILVQPGTIVVWYKNKIPEGWHICNGANGTPDLRSKFIMGASAYNDLNKKGGTTNHSHITNKPNKRKRCVCNSGGTNLVEHGHTHSTNTKNHLPPFIKLFYIMKL